MTTTISRVCLDQLGSARAKREQYIGPWLPEPLAGVTPDIAETVADFDSLSIAFLVLLESLSPKERAVFLLHDVFGYDFSSIGTIVGESDAYCRQLAKRARAHMAERRPRFTANRAQQERLTADFLRAVSEGDLPALIETLTEDVTVYSDGGGKVNAARKPVAGRDKVALFLTNLMRLAPDGTSFRMEPINGQPGIVTLIDGAVAERRDVRFRELRHQGDLHRRQSRKIRAGGLCLLRLGPVEDQTREASISLLKRDFNGNCFRHRRRPASLAAPLSHNWSPPDSLSEHCLAAKRMTPLSVPSARSLCALICSTRTHFAQRWPGADAVLHLATRIPLSSKMRHRSAWVENDRIRAEGTRNLVDAAIDVGAGVFVYPSFAFSYPDCGDVWIDAASTPVDPIDILRSTIAAEREVARFAEGGGRGVSLRLGFLYGSDLPSTRE